MDHSEVVRRAKDAGVRLVSFLYRDNGGAIRGKSAHVSSLEGRLDVDRGDGRKFGVFLPGGPAG
jgi:hypothetical protein